MSRTISTTAAVHPLQALLDRHRDSIQRATSIQRAESERESLRGRRDRWSLENFAGRTIELRRASTAPALTAVSRLVLEAQRLLEPCVWICAEPSIFYPPDFEAAGIDLTALPVIRCALSRSGMQQAAVRAAGAADLLMRSGGFGLVVIDLGAEAGLSMPIQTRLTALARHHGTALVLLTRPRPGSRQLGSLVSLRGGGLIQRMGFDRFIGEIHIEKDRRRSPGWRHVEVCRGPDGLC